MQIGILGPLHIATNTTAITIGGPQVRALLIRLCLDPGRIVTVGALASALWPEGAPAQPANAVQTLVSRLRRALPGEGMVRSVTGGYLLDLPPEAVDAIRFERLAREGRQALTAGDERTAASRLREALALWRGEALADVADAPYAMAVATRLAELRLAATEDRIAAELTFEPPSHLVAELRELATSHPLRERVRALLVRALHAGGRTAEALAAYEEVRRLLAEELGTDPGPELRAAHLAALRSAPAPPIRPRGNLRAELTSFVGRDEDRRRITKQLGEGRLVTLVGPGGAGKTRLATTVAADLAGAIPGGAWLVELAAVADPGDVAPAVLAALGLREAPRDAIPAGPVSHAGPAGGGVPPRAPTARLIDALAGIETLLVLDNCEHLLDPTARLAEELLGRCPRLRILTTSREPLGIGGETLSPVLPLGLPEPDAPTQGATAYPAVRLFADRAAAARPGFAVTGDTMAPVVEICRRLDGLPLAIELAAARLRSLTLEQVATRLDDRFRLLATGSRTAVPRHRTLRAVVAWSWDLLDPDERQVAQRLAVFPGTITPAAAEQVCHTTVDTLAALVDKSLLQLVDGAEPQYRLLETIREYGLEQLAASGELDEVRAAHAAYYLRLAERAAPHLRGAGQLPWIARLHAGRGSLAAFGFARDTGDAGTAVRLAAALSYFWTIMGNHATVALRLRTALDVPGDAAGPARAAVTAAYLFNALLAGDDPGEAVEFCRRDRSWASEQPYAAMLAAMLAIADGDARAGLAATEPRLSDPDPWVRGTVWLLRAWLCGNDGAFDRLRDALDRAVAAFREAGERWGLATSLTQLAHTQVTAGAVDGAIAGLTEAIALLRELDPADPAVQQRVVLAAARAQQGDRVRARVELQELVAPAGGTAPASYLVLARISLGDLARLEGDLAEAARQYDAAAAELARVPYDASLFRAMLLCARGHLAVATGDLSAARWQLAEAFARTVEFPDLAVAAETAVAVARLRSVAGPAGTAAEVLGAAHALRGAPDASDPDVVAVARELRAALGERAYQAAYDRGRGLGGTDALALIQAQVVPS